MNKYVQDMEEIIVNKDYEIKAMKLLIDEMKETIHNQKEEIDRLKSQVVKLNEQVSQYQDEIFARDNNWYDMQD